MGTTFLKRQKEMKRMEKQRAKAERRAQKKLAGQTPKDEFGEDIVPAGEETPDEEVDVATETNSPI
jgi:hypothetical protein